MLKNEFSLNLCGYQTLSLLKGGVDYCDKIRGISSIELKKTGMDIKLYDIKRFYIGSEFCNNYLSLFSADNFQQIINVMESKGIMPTIVFPNLNQHALEHAKKIVTKLAATNRDTIEFVFNDYGLLNFASNEFPNLNLSVGRMFNKISKDPRVDMREYEGFKNNQDVLEESGLCTPVSIQWLKAMNVKRVELELMENNMRLDKIKEHFDISIHFPWIYVTSGNICALGSLNSQNDQKFKIKSNCSYECNKYYAQISNPVLRGEVCEVGNAILYRPKYELEKVENILEINGLRVVYSTLNQI